MGKLTYLPILKEEGGFGVLALGKEERERGMDGIWGGRVGGLLEGKGGNNPCMLV
jgi:hypothetical protein